MLQTRRDTLLTFGAVWTSLALPAGAFAQPGRVLNWTPKALTAAEAATLVAAVDAIIPATDTPGAVEAGVPQFIDRTLAAWAVPEDAALLRAGLARLDEVAKAQHGGPFAGLSPELRTVVLTGMEAEAMAQARLSPPRRHFFPALRELATVGYFTSEPGATKAARYDPVPGDYKGCIPLSDVGRVWAL
jgi:hypothetical protein